MTTTRTWCLIAALVLLLGTTGLARIKLVALPERAASIIRLDNPQATLIEEERVLTLQQGVNQVDFSWNGVSIDADSIRLALLSHPGQVRLLNVSYPPGEAALVWEIACDAACEERVRISYLLLGIDCLVTYTAVADRAETQVSLKSFLVLRNFSGEDFERARVMLGYGEAFEEGIRHEATKQLLFLQLPRVPVTKIWTFDAARLPWDPAELDNRNVGIPVSYRLVNSRQTPGLGQNALRGGKVRLFQADGHGGTIFLGEDITPLVPVGEKTELYIGDSRDIVVTQRRMKEEQVNIRRNQDNRIVLFDTEEVITAVIENFKDTPAVLTMVQHIEGQWEMLSCNMEYTRRDVSTLEFEIQLPARGQRELTMTFRRQNLRPDRTIDPRRIQ